MSKTHTTGAFGGIGCHLSGLPPKMRAKRRQNLRIAGWLRRAESMPAPEVAPQIDAERIERAAESLGNVTASSIAGNVVKLLGRVFGRKGGRKL